MSNTVPRDWTRIVMPTVTEDSGDWTITDRDSPYLDRQAAVLVAFQFRRELGYDFPFLGRPRDFVTHPRLFAAHKTGGEPRYGRGTRVTYQAPAWALCRRRPDGTADIGVLWVHPHYRSRGMLRDSWSQLCEAIGDPSPWVDQPWSKATAHLLRAVGHVQPDPDPKGDDR